MYKGLIVFIACGLLLPAASWAKGRPEPVPCPEGDVLTAIAEQCPCEGTTDETTAEIVPWRNHGKYVRCVVKSTNMLRKSGCLEKAERRQLKRCAARSTCGKAAAVLCCITKTDTCNGAVLDPETPGTCGDSGEPCLTDDDCAHAKVRLARSEDVCLERGGEPAGPGSMCVDPAVACVPEEPQPVEP